MAFTRRLISVLSLLALGAMSQDCDHEKCETDKIEMLQVVTKVSNEMGKSEAQPISGGTTCPFPSKFNYAKYQHSMSMTAKVEINGVMQKNGVLGAFVGCSMRGLGKLSKVIPFGPYAGKKLFQIMMYADAGGEDLTFKYKAIDGTITDLTQEVTFKINDNKGSIVGPIKLSA